MNRQTLTVAVVGATGVVGRTMIQILNEREFPVGELRLLASGRSAGRTVSIEGRTLEIGEAVPEAFEGVDIALFSAGADVSKELAPAAVARGATVIDNSSAWRMDPSVPLVVSQVNPDDLEGHQGIIANPNCSTMQLAPVLMALRDAVGLERVVVDTYQSVSGTGADAIAELEGQIRAHVAGQAPVANVYPHPIAFNALPEIDVFLPNGYTKEEWKVVTENRKILHLPDLRISCTAVRIPVFVSHSEAVHVETREPITPERARELFAAVPGVVVQDDPASARLPAGDRGRRARRDLRRAGPAGRLDRRTTAASPSGSSRTTCARAPPRTPSSSPRSCASAAGSSRLGHACAGRTEAGAAAGRRRGHGVTDAERRAALEAIAAEVRVCTNCRLHETRTRAVPGEGDPETEVVFVGEGPGFNEDRQGRPFVGRAGDLLVKLLASIGWRREDVFITNVVKCRPPDNRDPQPDEIAACAPYLRRQLEVLDPAVVVTLGRFSMATLHAGRADLAGPRDRPAGRPGDRRELGAGLRDVPPGRRAPDARHRARELRGHRDGAGRAPRRAPSSRTMPATAVVARRSPVPSAPSRLRRRDRSRRPMTGPHRPMAEP